MKKTFFFLLVALVVAHSQAQDRRFGLGVILGDPTGISAKYWTTGTNALAFGVGWSSQAIVVRRDIVYSSTRFEMHADYLWHAFDAIRSSERFPLFYGVGARLETGGVESPTLGVRGVFGIAWLPHNTSLDVFIEVAPTLQLAPSTGIGVGVGFGSRYFF